MNKGLLERLLHHILRILVVPHHSQRYAKHRVCGWFAKVLERSRISALCSGEELVFLSRNRAWIHRITRSSLVVILQTLRGHAAAPLRQLQLVTPSPVQFSSTHGVLLSSRATIRLFRSRCCARRAGCNNRSRRVPRPLCTMWRAPSPRSYR